ncbi:MAG: GGDEF domain-containing protein [Rubrivivax sp.]|jgi:diguanylate cyclase (GGDEF)-like protein|nr:GGDEF domain-containing protein [Rubrivivax sp.]
MPVATSLDRDDELDAALAAGLADGVEALCRAQAIADDDAAAPARRACAWALGALVQYRDATVDDADASLSRALLMAGPAPPPRLRDLLEHVQAQRTRRLGQLTESQERLLALHRRADRRPDADAYLTAAALGIVESMLGRAEAALDALYQALHLARRTGLDSLVVNALSNLGSYESDLYNLEDAQLLLEEAVAGACRLESRRLRIFAAGNLVQCLCLRGEPVRALAVAREHLIPQIREDDPPALQRDDEIAMALLANGLIDEADALLARELYSGALTNELATARVTLIGKIRLARDDPAGALAMCLERRVVLAAGGEQVSLPIDQVELLRTASSAAAAVGDPAQAHALLQEAFALYEDLLGRAARSRRLSLQIAHRLRQAEWERDSARQMATALEGLNASLRAEAEENERLKRQLMAHALEDPLTGLPNRRHLFEAGARLLMAQRRRGGSVAAALIDLDHFKQVNDRHGHDAGDTVLRRFAALLQRQTRAGDIACRYGGEEFVLLMADASAAQAAQRLRLLLVQFRAIVFEGRASAYTSAFSAGTATWLGDHETLEGLLQRADAALYAAKAAGRARVMMADEAAAAPG